MTVSHPPYRRIAGNLRDFANVLDALGEHNRRAAAVGNCHCLGCRAEILAARGFPTGTLGSGARSSDTTSSTERAVGLGGGGEVLSPPDPVFVGIDQKLAKHMRLIWAAVTEASGLVGVVNSHAPDDDPIPAGTGHCECCERFCRPDGAKDPDNRLRGGFCPACWRSWLRWRTRSPDALRTDFMRWRRQNMNGAA